MKQSRKLKKSSAIACAINELPREEWDFEKCPTGLEFYCFRYEYAREVPWIRDEHTLARRCNHKVNFGWRCGFDEHGNWHFWRFGNSEQYDDWALVLQIPEGFPDKAYLNTKHHVVHPKGFGTTEPPLNEAGEWVNSGFSDLGNWTRFRMNWEYPDKRLVADFGAWLKRNRPKEARERRGGAESRHYRKALKALGAYRLLTKGGMTAPEALEYTKRFLPHGLYAKVPDWYEAKKFAEFTLREEFRRADESIAALVLADEPCATCPGREQKT